MRINSFSVQHKNSTSKKTFNFNHSLEFFFSERNSVGKTTFLRGLLYCLGFTIPSTKRVKFENYLFECNITTDKNEDISIKRNSSVILLNDMEFNQQTDFLSIMGRIFSLVNINIINNFLAVIYVDQEKGWTLLNRGKIIGNNSFNIESFLRGLDDKDVIELTARLSIVENDIDRYSLMLNVADYQKRLEEHKEEIRSIDFNDEIEAEIGIMQSQIDNLDKDIRNLSRIKRQNDEFVNYISKLGLQIEIEGKEYTISKSNLLNFNDIQEINEIRLIQLRNRKNELLFKKTKLETRIKPKELLNDSTVIDSFDNAISRQMIDALQVKSILNKLNNERKEINNKIKKATSSDNKWISILNGYIRQYWSEMGVELEYKDSFLLTKDLKSLSGALLYKIIVVFRLAYMRTLFEKTNILFPIFIDSPAGREVKDKIVSKALSIIKRDFTHHQIFISSIKKYSDVFDYNSESIIFFDDLHAFDPPYFFEDILF